MRLEWWFLSLSDLDFCSHRQLSSCSVHSGLQNTTGHKKFPTLKYSFNNYREIPGKSQEYIAPPQEILRRQCQYLSQILCSFLLENPCRFKLECWPQKIHLLYAHILNTSERIFIFPILKMSYKNYSKYISTLKVTGLDLFTLLPDINSQKIF